VYKYWNCLESLSESPAKLLLNRRPSWSGSHSSNGRNGFGKSDPKSALLGIRHPQAAPHRGAKRWGGVGQQIDFLDQHHPQSRPSLKLRLSGSRFAASTLSPSSADGGAFLFQSLKEGKNAPIQFTYSSL
jgi:hypothetical protein